MIIGKCFYFSILINYLFCKGFLFSTSKINPKRYCTPCSNNDDNYLYWEDELINTAYKDSLKNNSNITKN